MLISRMGVRPALILMLMLLQSSNAIAATTLILAGKMLDVESGQIRLKQKILIRDGIIVAVGSDIAVPKSTQLIDLSSMTVLPGLIDSHTHLVGDTIDQDSLSELRKSAAERAFESIPNARAVLLAGFTTVRDLGCYRALVNVALRDAINRGDVVGPRMFASGGYITMTGGGGSLNGIAPDLNLPWDLRFGVANGSEQIRQRVREFASYNVDVIKIFATGAIFQHQSLPGMVDYSYAELRAAVLEAKQKGLRVAAHAHGTEGIKNAIRAGVASIEHGTMLDDEAIKMMKAHGTYLVSDIYSDDCVLAAENKKKIPQDFLIKERQYGERQRQSFKLAVQAGVNIAYGTDSYVCPHGTNARQFAYQVKYGQTPLQAIQSATINAATLLGKSDKLGAIKSGQYADLVAVQGNPLENIRVLEDVAFVMKEGKVYKAPA